MAEHTFYLLPVADVEAGDVEPGLFDAVRLLCDPRIQKKGKLVSWEDVFVPGAAILDSAVDSHTQAVDFEPAEPIYITADRLIIP